MRIWSELEENVDQLLESKSELGTNLLRQKRELERLAVPAEVRLRHGIVIDQVFEEAREGDYDLIVTGTSPGARSVPALHHGRSHPQHFESRKLSRPRRARRQTTESGPDSLESSQRYSPR